MTDQDCLTPTQSFAILLRTIGTALGEQTAEKSAAYGDAVSATESILLILYPTGVSPDDFKNLLLITRTLDKITRLARGEEDAFEESPWDDIVGYGLIGSAKSKLKSLNLMIDNPEEG